MEDMEVITLIQISIHKALAGLDPVAILILHIVNISIHKALAGLDRLSQQVGRLFMISIHKALAGLDNGGTGGTTSVSNFNPQGPRGPRLRILSGIVLDDIFQSTRPSRASTEAEAAEAAIFTISIHKALAGLDDNFQYFLDMLDISIHKALAGLDEKDLLTYRYIRDFNPQGPRGPRLRLHASSLTNKRFQSTRPSRASTQYNLSAI